MNRVKNMKDLITYFDFNKLESKGRMMIGQFRRGMMKGNLIE